MTIAVSLLRDSWIEYLVITIVPLTGSIVEQNVDCSWNTGTVLSQNQPCASSLFEMGSSTFQCFVSLGH